MNEPAIINANSGRTLGRRVFDFCTSLQAQLIGLRNPQAAMSYIRGRQALLSYTAGTKRGPNRNFRPKNTTADDLIRKDWPLVVARARYLARNSGYVSGALKKICDNVVSDTGIRPQVQLRGQNKKLDRDRNRALEAIFRKWAEHPRVRFFEKQKLALRHNWVDGECILHLYESPTLYREGIVPLGLELLEADHLDSSVNGQQANGFVAMRGIEFDAEGFPVAYHLFTEHPGASMTGLRSISLGKSVRVDASRIIHPFERTRASQSRGMSWLAPVVMEMHDLNEYQDSERIAARLTSAFGFFIETNNPDLTAAGLLGAGLPGVTPAAPELPGAKIPTHVETGGVHVLPQGTKLHGEGFNRPGSNYDAYVRSQLKGVSAGFGMSYHAYSNDYSDASYSAARSASLEERRSYKNQQAFLVSQLCTPVWNTWLQFLALSGLAEGIVAPGADIPVTWQTPGWPWVDPLKDAKASQTELEMGVTSRRRIAASKGDDIDDIMAERAEEDETYGPLAAAKPNDNKGASDAPEEG
ncbi:MAG: phage portal protein [Proteobacteria bacterium]|nr:phage portal protein [Pseudomonadota bacterium]MBU1594252.1 phage portal protein [Pseudomonadota bacterium]